MNPTPKIKIFVDSAWTLERIVNPWLQENANHVVIRDIKYQFPDSEYDRASVMIFYEAKIPYPYRNASGNEGGVNF